MYGHTRSKIIKDGVSIVFFLLFGVFFIGLKANAKPVPENLIYLWSGFHDINHQVDKDAGGYDFLLSPEIYYNHSRHLQDGYNVIYSEIANKDYVSTTTPEMLNDYCDVIDTDETFTFGFWMRNAWTSFDNGNGYVFETETGQHLGLNLSGNTIEILNDNIAHTFDDSIIDQWVFWTFTVNKTEVKMYMNGVLRSTYSINAQNLCNYNYKKFIWNSFIWSDNPDYRLETQFLMFNSVLSETQIQDIQNNKIAYHPEDYQKIVPQPPKNFNLEFLGLPSETGASPSKQYITDVLPDSYYYANRPKVSDYTLMFDIDWLNGTEDNIKLYEAGENGEYEQRYDVGKTNIIDYYNPFFSNWYGDDIFTFDFDASIKYQDIRYFKIELVDKLGVVQETRKILAFNNTKTTEVETKKYLLLDKKYHCVSGKECSIQFRYTQDVINKKLTISQPGAYTPDADCSQEDTIATTTLRDKLVLDETINLPADLLNATSSMSSVFCLYTDNDSQLFTIIYSASQNFGGWACNNKDVCNAEDNTFSCGLKKFGNWATCPSDATYYETMKTIKRAKNTFPIAPFNDFIVAIHTGVSNIQSGGADLSAPLPNKNGFATTTLLSSNFLEDNLGQKLTDWYFNAIRIMLWLAFAAYLYYRLTLFNTKGDKANE